MTTLQTLSSAVKVATDAATQATGQANIATLASKATQKAATEVGATAGAVAAAAVVAVAINNRIYPGVYNADPVTRPDGSAIQDGDVCTVGAGGVMRVRIAGAWADWTAPSAAAAAAAADAAMLAQAFAEEWASETASDVDGAGNYSAKEYAQGAQAGTGGSAKNWAQQTGAVVTGAGAGSRSAKSWAQDNLTPGGANLGGSAKDWAIGAGLPDGANKSAKGYAADAAASLANIDSRLYPGTFAVAPATRPDTTAIQNGDRYTGTDGYTYARIGGAWVNQTAAAAASAAVATTKAGEASASATAADLAKTAAQAAQNAALIGAGVYATEAAGRAAVADGVAFKVQGDGATIAAYEYRRTNAGASVLIATYPSTAAVDALNAALPQDGTANTDVFKLVDDDGSVGVRIGSDDTFKTRTTEFGPNAIATPLLSMTPTAAEVFQIVDPDGFVGFKTGPAVAATGVTSQLNARNTTNLLPTVNIRRPAPRLQMPTAKLNVWIVYGQSFSVGAGSGVGVALSTAARLGNKMLGNSPRGGDLSQTSTAFSPIGGNILSDLIEVPQNDASAIVAAPASYGETVLSGLLNNLKRLHNDRLMLANDTSRIFAGACCGVGGKSIAQLSKGAAPSLYGRYLTALSGFKAAADAAGYDMAVCGILWMQGENDAGAAQATYLASLQQLYADMVADAKATTGQTQPPAFYVYQMGGSYASDNMGVANAHVQFCKTQPGAYFAGPVFPYPDPGSHLYANGYRWFGAQVAKVAHQVALGLSPVPFSMRSATYNGSTVLVDFVVPVPPLQFGTPYDLAVATDYLDKGFTVIDGSGTLTGANVVPTIVADTVIQLACSRALVGTVQVVLGDKTNHNGNHCVIDSDSAVSDDSWIYGVGGQPAAENIAALVGKPYPLVNWAGAGLINATYQP